MAGRRAASKSKKTPPHLRNHQSALAAGKRVQMSNNDADGDDNGLGPTDDDADDATAASSQQPPYQKAAPVSPIPAGMQKPSKKKARGMFAMRRSIGAKTNRSGKAGKPGGMADDFFYDGQ